MYVIFNHGAAVIKDKSETAITVSPPLSAKNGRKKSSPMHKSVSPNIKSRKRNPFSLVSASAIVIRSSAERSLSTVVEKSFAIQAGREIRVMVKPDQVDDAQALFLAKDIAKKIETELEYPGQIKVNVIREFRSVEYAK